MQLAELLPHSSSDLCFIFTSSAVCLEFAHPSCNHLCFLWVFWLLAVLYKLTVFKFCAFIHNHLWPQITAVLFSGEVACLR